MMRTASSAISAAFGRLGMPGMPGMLGMLGMLFVVAALGACSPTAAPAPSCVSFVACVQARDAARGTTTDVDRFLEGGACWTSAPEGQRACETACTRGLDVLRSFADAPEACAP